MNSTRISWFNGGAGMWNELGIAPCEDPKAIRRAYAAQLKKLDPDRDPEAFARLRGAFEWALSGAGRDDRPGPSDAPPPASTHRDAEAENNVRTASHSEREPDRSEPAAEHSSVRHAENTQLPALQPP